jgi:hypothetical protein
MEAKEPATTNDKAGLDERYRRLSYVRHYFDLVGRSGSLEREGCYFGGFGRSS